MIKTRAKNLFEKGHEIIHEEMNEDEIKSIKDLHDFCADLKERYGYRDNRAKNYPPVGDQLDSIWKIIDHLMNRTPLDQTALEVMKKIKEVKKQFPKPKIKK